MLNDEINCLMKRQPVISVIIPVYNTEKYLEASVRSVMDQTYRNIEIICVNDGSTDSSLEILDRLEKEDDRIKVISKENGGLGDTRNCGIRHSSSEWLVFLDSDDTLRSDTIELVAEAISHDPDMIHFGIEMVMEDGSDPNKRDIKYYSIAHEGLVEITDSIILKSDVSAANKAFRKSVIDRYGLKFEKIHYEDFPFVVQYMSVISKVFYIKEKLYNYLRRAGSIMSDTFNKSPRAIDHLYAYSFVLEFLKKNGILEEHRRMMVKFFMACYTFVIRYSSVEMLPEVVDYATGLYEANYFLYRKLERKIENGTVVFMLKKKKKMASRILQKIFSMRYEYIDYNLYKVIRIFGLIVYKEARR